MTDVRRGNPAFLPNLECDTRLRASVERLLRSDYEIGPVLESTLASDWPGDLAGRLLLSLSRLARAGAATGDRAVELNTVLLAALEPRGYLGPAIGGVSDEQQVACHGWVVAGLLQHFYLTANEQSRAAAFRVLDELIVPSLTAGDYPWTRDTQPEVGGPSGTATQIVDGWALSSDGWCVLLTLNGLVPAALESGRRDLAELIESLAITVSGLDPVGQSAQLHAVLAAARNFADWTAATGSAPALATAIALYDVYETSGRTLNYATYNWFGRPDSWTEPCAIVDSLGVATTLFALTGHARYRLDATRIARNGLDFAERPDGSFGLDSVATPSAPVITSVHPDAHWCCTIRGAVGLVEARETAAVLVGDTLTISDPYPGEHRHPDGWVVRQTVAGDYPSVQCELVGVPAQGEIALSIELTIEGRTSGAELGPERGAQASIRLDFNQAVESIEGGELVWVGPVLQVRDGDDNAAPRVALTTVAASPSREERPRVLLT
jgi:hypothetical protein